MGDQRLHIADLMAAAAEIIMRFTPAEAFVRSVEERALVVDTRDQQDRIAEGVVPGSVHIPRSVLEWRADPTSGHADERLTAGTRLIVMCSDGYSSVLAASNLVQLGHAGAGDVIGGYRAWKRAGLPVVAAPGSD